MAAPSDAYSLHEAAICVPVGPDTGTPAPKPMSDCNCASVRPEISSAALACVHGSDPILDAQTASAAAIPPRFPVTGVSEYAYRRTATYVGDFVGGVGGGVGLELGRALGFEGVELGLDVVGALDGAGVGVAPQTHRRQTPVAVHGYCARFVNSPARPPVTRPIVPVPVVELQSEHVLETPVHQAIGLTPGLFNLEFRSIEFKKPVQSELNERFVLEKTGLVASKPFAAGRF